MASSLPDQTARVGAIMLSESHRLARLVGDLLDLARLDAQEFRVDLGCSRCRRVIDSAADVWSGRCAAEGVRFVVERPAGPLIAWTDASRLRQVLDGLLENALRVTPSGFPDRLGRPHGTTGAPRRTSSSRCATAARA